MKRLGVFARAFPHMVYSGLMVLIQIEWKFVQRVIPVFGTFFVPLEAALRNEFLPFLLGFSREEFTDSLHKQILWGVKQASIGIPYLTLQF